MRIRCESIAELSKRDIVQASGEDLRVMAILREELRYHNTTLSLGCLVDKGWPSAFHIEVEAGVRAATASAPQDCSPAPRRRE